MAISNSEDQACRRAHGNGGLSRRFAKQASSAPHDLRRRRRRGPLFCPSAAILPCPCRSGHVARGCAISSGAIRPILIGGSRRQAFRAPTGPSAVRSASTNRPRRARPRSSAQPKTGRQTGRITPLLRRRARALRAGEAARARRRRALPASVVERVAMACAPSVDNARSCVGIARFLSAELLASRPQYPRHSMSSEKSTRACAIMIGGGNARRQAGGARIGFGKIVAVRCERENRAVAPSDSCRIIARRVSCGTPYLPACRAARQNYRMKSPA